MARREPETRLKLLEMRMNKLKKEIAIKKSRVEIQVLRDKIKKIK